MSWCLTVLIVNAETDYVLVFFEALHFSCFFNLLQFSILIRNGCWIVVVPCSRQAAVQARKEAPHRVIKIDATKVSPAPLFLFNFRKLHFTYRKCTSSCRLCFVDLAKLLWLGGLVHVSTFNFSSEGGRFKTGPCIVSLDKKMF